MWLVDRTYGKRAGNNMEPKEDAIVDIPKERLKFLAAQAKCSCLVLRPWRR